MSIASDNMYLDRAKRICRDLYKLRDRKSVEITGLRHRVTPDRVRDVTGEDPTDDSVWQDFGHDDRWGGYRTHAAFAAEVEVPEDFKGLDAYVAVETGLDNGWDATNPQFLFYVDQEARQAFDHNHRSSRLADEVKGGERFKLYFSAYAADIREQQLFRLKLQGRDRKINQLFYDLKVAVEAADLMEKESESFLTIINLVNDTINLLDLREPYSEAFYASVDEAIDFIDEELYTKASSEGKFPVVKAVGHTHIDVAWLWDLATTRNKAVHSFTTVLELMERYPEYIFMSSQAQLYAYVKEDAPDVYERIKERVKEGRWETEGGMWVEADCNVSSGEALVRQFLYGKKFFREEFGQEHRILWLPDVFGYSAAMPQILKKSGVDYFMTTKISWNEYNQLPYDTFLWEGIDGSKVLTHFIPAQDYQPLHRRNQEPKDFFSTYNGYLNANQVLGSWDRYQQKDLNKEVLMSYGHGDGGGGTTEDMVENQRRLAKGLPGVPRTEPSTALDFFEKLEEDVIDNPHLPHWAGELYFEYHRGTYTTHGKNKQNNRRSEFGLQNVEFLSQLNNELYPQVDQSYPSEDLLKHWHTVLKNQFHDILPGTSIKEVYEDSDRDYAEVLGWVQEQLDARGDQLSARVKGESGDVVVVNPTAYPFSGLLSLTQPQAMRAGLIGDEYSKDYLGQTQIYVSQVPAFGYRSFSRDELERLWANRGQMPAARSLKVSEHGFENDCVKVEWDEEGEWTSFYDKAAARELLPEGERGNRLVAYEDKPHNFEAWDINIYYQEKSFPVHGIQSIEVIEDGQERVGVAFVRKYGESTITQRLFLEADSPQITMDFEIDWQATNELLKLHFPYDLFTREASFDIQFGNVRRPIHTNTSWDLARFEVSMHKWLSVNETGYGLTVLSDSKYGTSVKPNDIGLSLLRSPRDPDPTADIGFHHFRYAIFPYEGSLMESETESAAYHLNNPPQVYVKAQTEGFAPKTMSLVRTSEAGVTIEGIKQAESGEGTIVRLYESGGMRHQDAELLFGRPVAEIEEVDLQEFPLEDGEGKPELLDEEQRRVGFRLDPYEIKTFRVVFDDMTI